MDTVLTLDADAVSIHVDLMLLPELGVQKTIPTPKVIPSI